MKIPKGWKRLKKRAKIPIYVQGEKKPRYIYRIIEVEQAAALMKEMAESIETLLGFGFRPDLPQAQRNELKQVMEGIEDK